MTVKDSAKYESLLYEKIKETLWQSHRLDYQSFPYIELLCIPCFTDYFLLQMTWNKHEMYWHRTTWQRDSDKEAQAIWLEYIHDDNEILPIELTLVKEEGRTERNLVNGIIQEINSLSIKPILLANNQKGRDGEDLTLKIGLEEISLCLTWWTANTPPAWEGLDRLVDSILLINKLLK